MRAALLPTPGNPFLIEHWLRNYEQVWADEVDELRVLVNAQPVAEVREAIREAVERRGAIYMESEDADHGPALRTLVDSTEADLVMLCEDDCRVRLSGEVEARFARLESGVWDVIGSPRGSMTNGIACRAREVLPEVETPMDCNGYHGHGMWPAFVFARRSALLATDQDYGARMWTVGTEVLGLDFHAEEIEVADTFGATSLQLRARFNVTQDVQFKGPDGWPEHLFRGSVIPWFHIGSLSSWTFNGEYLHAEPSTKSDELQWAHRFAWWRRVWETTEGAFEPWRDSYIAAWDGYRTHMGISVELVDSWTALLDEMVTWDERRT